ncbi:MAG: hypothetical protein ACIAS6_00660 [Phycisphaerales bacterium JB060]
MARTILTTLVALATAALLFLAGGSSTNGCLWDSDTLRTEASGAPGMVETIVGRFDRYPPLYYEMRLDRVTKELATDPADHLRNLAAYDDAGVACDRLGRHDEAIAWMARKRVSLDALADSEAKAEHEYRYLANLGTFHAHRWIAAGADRSDMADIERARDLIAQAIELNPDAHFGREHFQLAVLEWILELPQDPTPEGDLAYIRPDQTEGFYILHLTDLGQRADGPEGVAGLVALGNAWNSFDVFFSLGLALNSHAHNSLAHLARLRAKEIADAGGRSLHAGADLSTFDPDDHVRSIDERQQAAVEAFYTQARAEADAWHAARTQYIMARLEQGRHPDTHPDFFAAWVEPSSMPALPNGFLGIATITDDLIRAIVIGIAVLAVLLLVALSAATRFYRRRAEADGPERPAPTTA